MIADCIDAAVRQGHISADEGAQLKKRYDNIVKARNSSVDAKAQLVKEIEAEADARERAAYIAEGVRKSMISDVEGYRNLKGEADLAEGFLNLFYNDGRKGSYIKDAENARAAILGLAERELGDFLIEFRKGAITGTARRMLPKQNARMQNIVRELFGEKTDDVMASGFAKAIETVFENLRLRFNEAGGTIGKLDKFGLPQSHDPQALRDAGPKKWIEHMMQPGVLDRERTVHPLTLRRMTDEELRESLSVIWDRITTDGWSDREITGAPVGKGALWTQHADHRFLHFKDADAWMTYAKAYGNPEPYAVVMNHISRMARDIAHMERFGPNPKVMIAYMKNYLLSKAAQIESNKTVIGEQLEQMADLAGQLSKPNPERAAIAAEIGNVLDELQTLRDSKWGRTHGRMQRNELSIEGNSSVEATEKHFQALYTKMTDLTERIKGVPDTIQDAEIARAIDVLSEEMRDPIQFATRKNPEEYLARKLKKADQYWEQMRGSAEPERAAVANVMASARNLISSATLGSAWLSSLNDPMNVQHMRAQIGMGIARSNVGTIFLQVLGEMITRGRREDAIGAGLGWDSATEILVRKAKENRTIDGRAWTGYLADRTLSLWGLSPWTQSGKHIVGTEFMRFMADQSKNDWARLHPGTRKALAFHGFDAASWDQIRNVPLYEPKRGVFFLQAPDIEAAVGRDLAERYVSMIIRETRHSVVESTVQSRAFINMGAPGSFGGELGRAMMQFKGYGAAVAFLKIGQIARELQAGDRSAAVHAGVLLITGTILGAFAMALKDIKDGRDPRKWLDEKTYLDPQFWGAAALQSGGLGIYGDFLFSNTGRTGGGLGKTMAGPLVDRMDNLLGLTIGNAAQGIRGEKTNRGREAVKFLRTNTPVIGNAPFVGLAYQRVLMDQLQRLADPEAHLDFRRQIQHRRKDFNQDFWWAPGNSSPTRGPDLTRPMATR